MEYKGKLVRNPTDLMLNQMVDQLSLDDMNLKTYEVYGHQLPSYFIRQSYRPLTQVCDENPNDYRMEKFGGKYPFFPVNQTSWPVCPECQEPMILIFQLNNPMEPSQFVQMMACTDFHYPSENCNNDCGICYQFTKFNLTDPHNNLPIPNVNSNYHPLECYKLSGWDICTETIHHDDLHQYFAYLSNIDEILDHYQSSIKKEVINNLLDKNDSSETLSESSMVVVDPKYDLIGQMLESSETLIKLDEGADGFKFGGFQRICQDSGSDGEGVDNFIQIGYHQPFLNYGYGDSGIIHIDPDGILSGDCY